MTSWVVDELEAQSLQDIIRALPEKSFLWQEEYPGTIAELGAQRLRMDPLPASLPRAGRVITNDFEVRFFEHGQRAVRLREQAQLAESASVEPLAEGPFDLLRSEDNRVPAGWDMSFFLYRDRTGQIVWTRWRVERSSHAQP